MRLFRYPEFNPHSCACAHNDNITKEIIGNNVKEYEYDSLNRLISYSDPVANVTEFYTYDNRGNILTVTSGSYGSDSQTTTTYTYGDETIPDRLTSYNGNNITYGTLGNPTRWVNGETMTWQYGRNLTSVNGVTYGYNADGLRVSKSGAKTTEYYLVGDQYIGEVTTIGETDYVISYVYDESDSVIGINVNGSPYFFAKNLQGDVVAILNYQGDVVARYTYDIWGKLVAVKNASGAAITSKTHVAHLNPFRYRGYMYDKETGFYYLRSRYYDPEVGRFLNGDSIVADVGGDIRGYNQFAYCFNNPVNMIDVSGKWPSLNDLIDFGKKALDLVIQGTVESASPSIARINKELHYSRNLLNDTHHTENELIEQGYIKEPESSDKFHQNNQRNSERNRKYVIGDWFSSEIVYYGDGTINNTPEDMGTFNVYSGDNVGLNVFIHGLYDVLPYMIWGNSEDDSTTIIDRIIMIWS